MSLIPKRRPKSESKSGSYLDDLSSIDASTVTETEYEALVDGATDEIGDRLLAKGRDKALARLDESGSAHVAGRYVAKSYTSAFGGITGESQEVTALKTLAPSDVLERHAKALHETYGVRGEALDAMLTTEEWWKAATIAQLPRHQKHAEAQRKLEAFESVAKTALVGDVDAQGGYGVPTIVGAEVFRLVKDASDIFARARKIPMSSDTMQFPDEATAVTTYWSATQGTALTAGEPVFGVKTLLAAKLIGRATFSIELVDDANIAVIPWLAAVFSEKFGGDLDYAAMEGSYAIATMPFTGVANATSVSSVTVASTNGTNGATLQYVDLINTFIAPGEGITRRDGIFVCGPGLFGKMLGMTDTNGQPLVRLGALADSPNTPTLFSRPVIVSNRMGLTTIGAGTNSVGNLYFGSPSALAFGVRQQMKYEITDAVNWATYRADSRLISRMAFVVSVPTAWSKLVGIKVKP